MVYKVFVTLYGRKLQFSTNAENRSHAERLILDKIVRATQIDDIREEADSKIVDDLMDIFGMFK